MIGGFASASQIGAESLVQAIICREGATLLIAQPASDSVVVDTLLPLSGTVTQATQIEITIDGQFNGVVPLNAAATSFATTVQLSPGTHTIGLTAVDACQIANATDQVVVTYQMPPANGGSIGGQTVTAVPAAASGVVVGGAALPDVATAAPTLFERLTQPFFTLGHALDLVSGPSATPSQPAAVPQLLRFSFVTVGLGVIIFATQIARWASVFQFGFVRLYWIQRPFVIGSGVGLIALGFLL